MLQTDVEDREIARREALRGYDVLDNEPEESFDRLTRLAQAALQTPVVLLSLIDRDRQWIKSRAGTGAAAAVQDIALCTHALECDGPTIVADARGDVRFRSGGSVPGCCEIGFYAGVPLRTPAGYTIGTLCALDHAPREITPGQLGVLQDIAGLVVDELELRKLATTDTLTGALTRRGLASETAREVARARRHNRALSALVFDVDAFKAINDRHGHAAGDLVLQKLVNLCRRELRSADIIGRLGGEEFAVALPETPLAGALVTAERIRCAFSAVPLTLVVEKVRVTASFGVSEWAAADGDFSEVLQRCDEAVYEAKRRGRDRCEHA